MEQEQLPPPQSQSVPPLPPPRERDAVIWGALLILAGALFLIGNFFAVDEGPIFLLIVGLAFLFAYFLGRNRIGFLIAGGIITGLGVGVLLENLLFYNDGVVLICLGLGFIFIWVIARNHVWAAITGAILAAIGISEYTNQWTDLWRWWPVALILVGIWVLVRRLQVARGGS